MTKGDIQHLSFSDLRRLVVQKLPWSKVRSMSSNQLKAFAGKHTSLKLPAKVAKPVKPAKPERKNGKSRPARGVVSKPDLLPPMAVRGSTVTKPEDGREVIIMQPGLLGADQSFYATGPQRTIPAEHAPVAMSQQEAGPLCTITVQVPVDAQDRVLRGLLDSLKR